MIATILQFLNPLKAVGKQILDYQEIKLNLIEAKRNKQLFKATCQALNHKLQALINAGADNRKTFNEVRTLES